MNICVIGTGYVGLVTGVIFADLGNDVTCVDKIKEKIDSLNKGIMPIYEPGLEEMVKRNVVDNRLFFSTDLHGAVEKAEIIFICVGTPSKDNGETDLSFVEDAAKGIAKSINGYKIVVNKSTVPVGTGDFVRKVIEKNKTHNTDFNVVSNPEFLREGSAIVDALSPDRIIIGASTKQVAVKLLELYASIGKPMLITDVYSAEIIKYASNSFLAMKISFINAMADICELTGANITDVTKGVGYDSRIGHAFLNAGLGFGGSCFPKDVSALVYKATENGYHPRLLRAVLDVNKEQPIKLLELLEHIHLKHKRVAILGLTFKAHTDDVRESPSLFIIKELIMEQAELFLYDPMGMREVMQLFPHLNYAGSAQDAIDKADIVLLLTDWPEFKALDYGEKLVIDGKNVFDGKRPKNYQGICW